MGAVLPQSSQRGLKGSNELTTELLHRVESLTSTILASFGVEGLPISLIRPETAEFPGYCYLCRVRRTSPWKPRHLAEHAGYFSLSIPWSSTSVGQPSPRTVPLFFNICSRPAMRRSAHQGSCPLPTSPKTPLGLGYRSPSHCESHLRTVGLSMTTAVSRLFI